MNKAAIRVGNFLFRYRNVIGPAGFLLAALLTKPSYPFGNMSWDWAFDTMGIIIAILGLMVRIVTIGYEYIERGGRKRQVYASKLIQRGIFGQCRNPMYVGNALICLGVVLLAHSYTFYFIVLPFVLLAYMCIVAAEEDFLRTKFGVEYEEYCLRVNRWLPSLSGWHQSLADMQFNWRRVVVKEYNTIFILGVVLALLKLWTDYRLAGPHSLPDATYLATGLTAWVALYIAARVAKKAGLVRV